jgi:hypothetical protein
VASLPVRCGAFIAALKGAAKKPVRSSSRSRTAGSGQRQKATHVGPGWKIEDWRSFKKLCTEGLLLEPDDLPKGGLLGYRRPSRFLDIAQAAAALRDHPIYVWLARHVPLAVEVENDLTPFVQMRRVRAVAEHMVFGCGLPLVPKRTDRQRKVAANAVERLLQGIYSGALKFPNPAREGFFEELLEEAGRILRAPQRQPRSHKYPWLRYLAQALHKETGASDPRLILEVAAFISPECEERTAQNYSEEARKEGDEK